MGLAGRSRKNRPPPKGRGIEAAGHDLDSDGAVPELLIPALDRLVDPVSECGCDWSRRLLASAGHTSGPAPSVGVQPDILRIPWCAARTASSHTSILNWRFADVRWPFRKARHQPVDTSVGIDEVTRCKPDQLQHEVGLPHAKDPMIWAAGDFTDIGLDAIDRLNVPIARRFTSVADMFQVALGSVEIRERAYRHGEGPATLYLLMSEHAFRAQKTDKRFRYVIDHKSTCSFKVMVVCSWLRPLEETW
jgi:hypothetical protein